jgi:hypothetical protein
MYKNDKKNNTISYKYYRTRRNKNDEESESTNNKKINENPIERYSLKIEKIKNKNKNSPYYNKYLNLKENKEDKYEDKIQDNKNEINKNFIKTELKTEIKNANNFQKENEDEEEYIDEKEMPTIKKYYFRDRIEAKDNNQKASIENNKYNTNNNIKSNMEENENDIFITKEEKEMLNEKYNSLFKNPSSINKNQEEILNSKFNACGNLSKKEERNSNIIYINETSKNKSINNENSKKINNNFVYTIKNPGNESYKEKFIKKTIEYDDKNDIIKNEKTIVNKTNDEKYLNKGEKLKENFFAKDKNKSEDNISNKNENNVNNKEEKESDNSSESKGKYKIINNISKEIREIKNKNNNKFENIFFEEIVFTKIRVIIIIKKIK